MEIQNLKFGFRPQNIQRMRSSSFNETQQSGTPSQLWALDKRRKSDKKKKTKFKFFKKPKFLTIGEDDKNIEAKAAKYRSVHQEIEEEDEISQKGPKVKRADSLRKSQ